VADAPDATGQNDDAALAARAKEHPASFAPLYRRYVGPIYGYCYQRLGTRELAEDATSQTFENALAAMPRYRAQSFRGWIYRIAHNVVIDQYRGRSHTPLDDAWSVPDGGISPERAALVSDSDRRVRLLLSQLSSDQRDVVELDLAGLTGSEIADVLGKRQGAIRAIRFRAYARLRELLAEGAES
jgi:RNA polymerase sigma-70 factor (ECF subfamily)